MFTGNYITTSFKEELLSGVHDFATHTFKLALYTTDAALNADTTAYTTNDEVVGSGYTAGGADLTALAPASDGTTAFVTFDDVSWASATLTARGGLLYNSSVDGNPAVAVLDFGAEKTSAGTPFTVQFPAATSDAAIVRIR
jgi:hypothetical protein